jgi:hypothetical protein
LIGEKFRAALGIAAPLKVVALAVQPTELMKKIAAAANIVKVSFRMGSPVRVSGPRDNLSAPPDHRPSNPSERNSVFLKFFTSAFEPIGSIDRHTRLWP